MPAPERNRLRRQKRGPLDCGFLDMSNHRCAIYPVRPWVCEAFGRVEGMRCPKVAKLVQIIPAFLADQAVRDEGASGIVGNSGEYLWRK
jgi:Fe-S-cluster containining protein